MDRGMERDTLFISKTSVLFGSSFPTEIMILELKNRQIFSIISESYFFVTLKK